MKKALGIGAAALAVTVIIGSGVGPALASPQDSKGESTLAVKSTEAVKVSPEQSAALEAESTPAAKLTPAVKVSPAERAAIEK